MSFDDLIREKESKQQSGLDALIQRKQSEAKTGLDALIERKSAAQLADPYERNAGPFDPEGPGYDYDSAQGAGLKPDETGHWPSRNPQTGQLLKGKKHPTWNLLEQGEAEAGMEIYQSADGKYYSGPGPKPGPVYQGITRAAEELKSPKIEPPKVDVRTLPAPANLSPGAPRPSESMQALETGRQANVDYRQKVQSGEISKGQLLVEGTRPFQLVPKMILLAALPASLPVGTGLTAGLTAIGSGAALNMGFDTADRLMSEGRLPTAKEYALSGVIGGVIGGVASPVVRAPLGRVVKSIARYFDTSPQQVNKTLHEVAREMNVTRGDIADNLILNAVKEPEGAKHFREFLDESALPSEGTIRGQVSPVVPRADETTLADIFQGSTRLGFSPEDAARESGIDFQSPGVREAFLRGEFVAPETRTGIQQESSLYTRPLTRPFPMSQPDNMQKSARQLSVEIAEAQGTTPGQVIKAATKAAKETKQNVKTVLVQQSENMARQAGQRTIPQVGSAPIGQPSPVSGPAESLLSRPAKTFTNDNRPDVVKVIEQTSRPTTELLQEAAAAQGVTPQVMLRSAHAEVKKTGKSIKNILAEKTVNGPTMQGKIDDVIGDRVVYRGAGDQANALAGAWQRTIENVIPETEINTLLDDLTRTVTPRTGNTVSESGKIIPGFQSIADGDAKLANFTENLIQKLDGAMTDKNTIPLNDLYDIANNLPDSAIARIITSGEVNAQLLNNMAVEVAALKSAARSQMDRLFNMVDDYAQGGKTVVEEIYKQLGVQMQILDSAGMTGSAGGRLLRTFGDFKEQAEYGRLFNRRMQKLFGAKPNRGRVVQFINDLKHMTPEDRLLALSNADQAGFLDKFFFFYKNGMLSGPRTFQKNYIGNILKQIAQEFERPLVVTGDYLYSMGGRIRPRERFFQESIEAMNSVGNGTLTGIETFFKRLKGGIGGDTAAKFDLTLGKGPRVYTNPFGSGLGAEIIAKPIQILDATDAAFKELSSEIAVNTITYRYARRLAAKTRIAVDSQDFNELIYELRTNPTDGLLAPIGKNVKGMTDEIRREVLESVFQSDVYRGLTERDSAEIGRALRDMSRAGRETTKYLSDPIGTIGEIVAGGVRRVPIIGEIEFPFRTAPLNLLRYSFERTMPYAPLISLGKIYARKRVGAPLELGEEFGKNAFGLLLAGGIGYLTSQGIITGGIVPDPKRKGLNRNVLGAGKVPYSINVGGKQIPYLLFEPFGPMMAIYADYMELYNEYGLASPDFWKGAALSFGNNVTRRTYLYSMDTLFSLAKGDWPRAREGLAFQMTGWTIPFSGALRTLGIATDVRRDPHNFLQEIMAQLPFLREQVPPMLDRWGSEIHNADTTYYLALKSIGVDDESILDAAQKVGVALAPLPSWIERKQDPANQGMLKIIDKTQPGETAIYGPPTWTKSFRGYSDAQFTEYQKMVGRREYQFMTEVVDSLGGPNGVRFNQIIDSRESREDFVKSMNNKFKAIRKRTKAELFGNPDIKDGDE